MHHISIDRKSRLVGYSSKSPRRSKRKKIKCSQRLLNWMRSIPILHLNNADVHVPTVVYGGRSHKEIDKRMFLCYICVYRRNQRKKEVFVPAITATNNEVPTPAQVVRYVMDVSEVDAFVAMDLEIERQTLGMCISDWLIRLHMATSQALFRYAEYKADAGTRNDIIAEQLFVEEIDTMENVSDWREWGERSFEDLTPHLQMSPLYKRMSDYILGLASNEEQLVTFLRNHAVGVSPQQTGRTFGITGTQQTTNIL